MSAKAPPSPIPARVRLAAICNGKTIESVDVAMKPLKPL